MSPVLALTLQAMQSGMRSLDRVAMNIANAQTPGYRREVASAGAFAQLVEAGGAAQAIRLDPAQGSMKPTGQALDLALSGPGWFEVTTEQGLAYTRLGAFRRDGQGRLVTQQGQAVMGTAGEIRLPDTAPFIDAQGRIFEAVTGEGGRAKSRGEPIAQLKLVGFPATTPAERLGDGLVRFATATGEVQVTGTEIRQGQLENANVSAMHEMVQLVQTMRQFESLQKVALGYDEMLGGAIRRLGENP